jgi:hypothetical protein
MILVVPSLLAASALFAAPDASSRSMPPVNGRSYTGGNCWSAGAGGSFTNVCGSGTATDVLMVALPVDAWATFNLSVDAYGGYLQTDNWVSCIGVAQSSEYNVAGTWAFQTSARATTSTANPQWQTLYLGTVNAFYGSALTLYCQATNGGSLAEVNWW